MQQQQRNQELSANFYYIKNSFENILKNLDREIAKLEKENFEYIRKYKKFIGILLESNELFECDASDSEFWPSIAVITEKKVRLARITSHNQSLQARIRALDTQIGELELAEFSNAVIANDRLQFQSLPPIPVEQFNKRVEKSAADIRQLLSLFQRLQIADVFNSKNDSKNNAQQIAISSFQLLNPHSNAVQCDRLPVLMATTQSAVPAYYFDLLSTLYNS